MALHPLNSFRRYHKTIFAGLTIVCMLTFVMSSGVAGMGDGFSWLQHMLTGTSRYAQVAKLYRKNIDVREMATLRERRILANRYMAFAVIRAHQNAINASDSVVATLDPQAQQQIRQILQSREWALNPALAQYRFNTQYLQNLPQYNFELSMIEQNLTKANKTADAEKIRLLRSAILSDQWMMYTPKDELYPQSDLYFGGSLSTEGLLDFMIWQSEADRLGIYLNNDDIARAIQDETLGGLTNEDGLMIEKSITPRNQSVRVDFVSALGEEFRVRLAQTTLLGFDPGGIVRVPAPVSPAELWTYFRRNRTELAVTMLPIPVSKFIDQVKDKPTEADLTKLFDDYKNAEYLPQSEMPGFKQPRRIKVEWIGARADAPHYRKEARKWIMSALASTPVNPWLAMALLDPVVSEYHRVTDRFGNGSLKIAPWTETGFALSFETYAHWQRAESAAALIGQLAGSSVNGNPLATFMASQAAAHARESKTQQAVIEEEAHSRATSAAALVTAGVAPSPVLVMCGLWQALDAKEFNLPMGAVKNRLVVKLEEDLAKDILTQNLATFRKDLEAAKGKAPEAEKVIEKFVKDAGWEHAASTTFDDMYNLVDDPKLAKLKDAYVADHLLEDPRARAFGFAFFSSGGQAQPKLYVPEEMRTRYGDTSFLFWRTADEPAKTLTFEQAKPAVEKAWRFQKARELAKQEAEKIAKQSPSDPLPALLDAAKKLNEKPFDLIGVAYLKPALQSRANLGGGSDFQPYRPPEDKIEYPAYDFMEKLMDPGTVKSAVVLANQPKTIEYVAVVTNRVEPTVRDFQRDTMSVFQINPLLADLEREKRLSYRIAVMVELREKAKLQILEGAAQSDSRGSDEDN